MLNMALGGTATEGWGGTTPVACTEFEIQVQVSDFLEYISVLFTVIIIIIIINNNNNKFIAILSLNS